VNVRILTDATGVVTDRYDYDAFGSIISQAGSTLNVYLYSGEQLDPQTAFYYLRARYLNPANGRMTTMDPAAGSPTDPSTFLPYAYAANDPINRLDPSGTVTLPELAANIAIRGILVGLEIGVARGALNTLAGGKFTPDASVLGLSLSWNGSAYGALSRSLELIAPFVSSINGQLVLQTLLQFAIPQLTQPAPGLGGTVGAEILADADTKKTYGFYYGSAGGGTGLGSTGATFTLYTGVVWNLPDPTKYTTGVGISFSTGFLFSEIPAGISYIFGDNSYAIGFYVSSGSSISVGVVSKTIYAGTLPYRVEPFFAVAPPPYGALLQWRAR
jgi:RHS repeat-associated protein